MAAAGATAAGPSCLEIHLIFGQSSVDLRSTQKNLLSIFVKSSINLRLTPKNLRSIFDESSINLRLRKNNTCSSRKPKNANLRLIFAQSSSITDQSLINLP